ncbi:MAG: LysR family transcriptional regulator, partial [Solobacterium sp.]|nr:LysR family transcriptional regulator [Solobacterium sp.]
MEIHYIIEFVDLADTKSYSESAKNLHISQSSLSRHIQFLEKELGEPLFVRSTRKMALSPFGRSYLPYAKKIAEANRLAEKAIQD